MPKKKFEATPKTSGTAQGGMMKKEATPKQNVTAQPQMKKVATPRQGQMKKEATPIANSAVGGALTGGAGQMRRQATPRTTSTGSGRSDPFLRGFNDDSDGGFYQNRRRHK